MATYPTCIVCGGVGCEFCPGTYLARALAACLDGRRDAPIELAAGIFVRAETVVRAVAPDAMGNVEARERLTLVERSA